VNCSFNNYAGIYLKSSGNVVIKNSTMIHNDYEGLVIQDAYYHRFPIKVMGSNISNNGDTGIYGETTSHVTISNNTILNNSGWGVHYHGFYSYTWTVENNTVSKNHGGGINVGGVSPAGPGGLIERIVNNTVMENDGEGIYVHFDDAYISGNTVARNSGSGIHISDVYAVIVENKILENGGNGIHIEYPAYGAKVTGNEISRNSGDGICIVDYGGNSDYYIGITKNLIVNSTGYGVNISHWDDGTIEIYLNSFYYNHGSGDEYNSSHIQARDNHSGGTVHWYSESLGKGNYWADWTEPDRNGDGIVDNPYILEGNRDEYPLTDPEVPIPEFPFLLIPILALFALALRRRS